MKTIEQELEEAKEYSKDGYINVALWRRLLRQDRVHYAGEAFKCRQALLEVRAKLQYLKDTEKGLRI